MKIETLPKQLDKFFTQNMQRIHRLFPKRLYHEKVLDHYNSPRNVGTLDKKSPSVGTGLVGSYS